ncbi:MAG: hypothetical protein Q8P76_04155 [bacterium]|nr:hypothetical protein [bacterium]
MVYVNLGFLVGGVAIGAIGNFLEGALGLVIRVCGGLIMGIATLNLAGGR